MDKVLNLFSNPSALPIIAMIIGFLWAWFKRKTLKSEAWYTELVMLLESAVTSVYHSYVRDLKKKAEDGKLTEQEKKEAMKQALTALKEFGRSRGMDLAKKYSDDILKAMLERAINKLKPTKP